MILQDPVAAKFWQATRPWNRNMGQMKCQKMMQRLGWNRDNDVNKWNLKQRLTSSTWKRGHHFFKKKTRPFPIDLFSTDLNLWHTCISIPPPWYKGGGGVDGAPPERFWYVAVFWSDFAFSGKRLICSTTWGIFYGWWRCWRPVTSPTMVANLDFTKN